MSTEETQPTIEATEAAPEATPATPSTPAIVMIDAPADEDATAQGRNERKTRVGIVTSDKMDKTIAVSVERRLQHPIYGKYVKKNKKFIAHDEKNECGIGDTVRIQETRPLSRRKRWRLVEVLEKAK